MAFTGGLKIFYWSILVYSSHHKRSSTGVICLKALIWHVTDKRIIIYAGNYNHRHNVLTLFVTVPIFFFFFITSKTKAVDWRTTWINFQLKLKKKIKNKKIRKIHSEKIFIFFQKKFFLIFCEMELSSPKLRKTLYFPQKTFSSYFQTFSKLEKTKKQKKKKNRFWRNFLFFLKKKKKRFSYIFGIGAF